MQTSQCSNHSDSFWFVADPTNTLNICGQTRLGPTNHTVELNYAANSDGTDNMDLFCTCSVWVNGSVTVSGQLINNNLKGCNATVLLQFASYYNETSPCINGVGNLTAGLFSYEVTTNFTINFRQEVQHSAYLNIAIAYVITSSPFNGGRHP